MPLKWLNLFIYFSMIYLIIMIMIHFMKKIKSKKPAMNNKNMMCNDKVCWIKSPNKHLYKYKW